MITHSSSMPSHKVGFHKKAQGVFTEELIAQIEDHLRSLPEVELVTDLDYKQAYVKNGHVYIGATDLHELDLYFWHDSVQPMKWGADNYYLNTMSVLEQDCVIVNTPTSIRIVNDKFVAHTVLKQHNLPVADFALVHAELQDELIRVFEEFGNDVVVKPRFGGWGIDVERVTSVEDLKSFAERALENEVEGEKQLFLERFYAHDPSKWTAVVVFGGKVLFGYRKQTVEGEEWKVYDPEKKDGTGDYSDYIDPPEDLKQTALAAAEAIGKDIIGFDCICTDNGYVIVDENGRPGLYRKCLDEAGVNIGDEVVQLIQNKLS